MSAEAAAAPRRLAGVFWMVVSTASYAVMGAGTKVAVPMAGLAAVVFWLVPQRSAD